VEGKRKNNGAKKSSVVVRYEGGIGGRRERITAKQCGCGWMVGWGVDTNDNLLFSLLRSFIIYKYKITPEGTNSAVKENREGGEGENTKAKQCLKLSAQDEYNTCAFVA
jgi:hypothetical protein